MPRYDNVNDHGHQMSDGQRYCLPLGSQSALCAELPAVYPIFLNFSPEEREETLRRGLSFFTGKREEALRIDLTQAL